MTGPIWVLCVVAQLGMMFIADDEEVDDAVEELANPKWCADEDDDRVDCPPPLLLLLFGGPFPVEVGKLPFVRVSDGETSPPGLEDEDVLASDTRALSILLLPPSMQVMSSSVSVVTPPLVPLPLPLRRLLNIVDVIVFLLVGDECLLDLW